METKKHTLLEQYTNEVFSSHASQPMNASNPAGDLMGWVMKFLKYWYLFVLGIVVALGLAFLENKSWTPTYKTATKILVQDQVTNNLMSASRGPVNVGRNYTNQMLQYRSYDFIAKVVDKLDYSYDIYHKHRFKNTYLYKNTSIKITTNVLTPQAYGKEFKLKGIDENTFSITYEGRERSFFDKLLKRNPSAIAPFVIQGKYGEPFQHSLFFLQVDKTESFYDPGYEYYVGFKSKGQQIAQYLGTLTPHLIENSSVIELSLMGKIAQRDVDFLTLLNETYEIQDLDYKNNAAEKQIEFIEEQLRIIRDSIDLSESRLNSYQLSSGLYSQQLSSSKRELLAGLESGRSDINLQKQYIGYLKNQLSSPDDELLTDPAASQVANIQLSTLVGQYNLYITEIRSLGPKNPARKKAEEKIATIKSQIMNVINTMSDALAIKEEDVNTRYRQAQGELVNLPKQERKLLTYERDFKINENYYSFLLQKRIESNLQKASNSASIQIVETPRIVSIVNGGEARSTYLVFLAIGLLLPALFVFCKEILFKFSIQSREDIERISPYPIVATIEHTKKDGDLLVVKNKPRSSFAEGFRNLRTRMEFVLAKETGVTLLVTSTEPSDGKTFIALNTASIYQLADKKVILLDCDLRRPMLSRTLGYESNKGLSNYLIGQASAEELIVTHETLGVDVFPSGQIPPNPSELIRKDKMKVLLKELAGQYDFIILDCSPVGLVSDGHFLSRLMDSVLFVVRNDKTNRNFVKYTLKEMSEDNINNLVLVYNDVDIKNGYYGNRMYYGKSSYYLKHGNYYHNDE